MTQLQSHNYSGSCHLSRLTPALRCCAPLFVWLISLSCPEMDGQRALVMRIDDRCKANIITWLEPDTRQQSLRSRQALHLVPCAAIGYWDFSSSLERSLFVCICRNACWFLLELLTDRWFWGQVQNEDPNALKALIISEAESASPLMESSLDSGNAVPRSTFLRTAGHDIRQKS